METDDGGKTKDVIIVILLTIIGFFAVAIIFPLRYEETCSGACGSEITDGISDCSCILLLAEEPFFGFYLMRRILPIMIGTGFYFMKRPKAKEGALMIGISVVTYMLTYLIAPFIVSAV